MKSLRQQMTDAMLLRGFAVRTQELCLAAVAALAKHYHRSPDALINGPGSLQIGVDGFAASFAEISLSHARIG